MRKLRGKEIRQSSLHEMIWITENMRVYVLSSGTFRLLKFDEHVSGELIVRCGLLPGGWCYVSTLMAECWVEAHLQNVKEKAYNNRKASGAGKIISYGKNRIELYNTDSICADYELTMFELRDIVERALRKNSTGLKGRWMRKRYRGTVSNVEVFEAIEREIAKEKKDGN